MVAGSHILRLQCNGASHRWVAPVRIRLLLLLLLFIIPVLMGMNQIRLQVVLPSCSLVLCAV